MFSTQVLARQLRSPMVARRSAAIARRYSTVLANSSVRKDSAMGSKAVFGSLKQSDFARKYSVVSEPSVSSQIESLQGVLPKDKEVNQKLMNQRIYKDARLPANEEEYDLYDDIYNLILERILPNIQEDGGNMEFRGFNFDTGTVFVKLTGACTSCSMSETTLKHGIEGMMTYFIPEVTAVKQVFDPEEEIAISEFEKLEKSLKNKDKN